MRNVSLQKLNNFGTSRDATTIQIVLSSRNFRLGNIRKAYRPNTFGYSYGK